LLENLEKLVRKADIRAENWRPSKYKERGMICRPGGAAIASDSDIGFIPVQV
jgi:hypothetical protein